MINASIKNLRIRNKAIDPHEIDIFLMYATGKSREFLWAHPEHILSSQEKSLFTRCIRRRLKHEPVAYIVGRKEFFGLDFKVNKHTLVPRPETELMVEEIRAHERLNAKSRESKTKRVLILDIGTGSGNIIITIAKNLSPTLRTRYSLLGTDISPKALKIARGNAKKHKVLAYVKFKRSDLLSAFLSQPHQYKKYAHIIIAANLPYLSKEIYRSAMPDVKNFEPKSALYSSEKGLKHYRRLFEHVQNIRQSYPGLTFILFLEISPEQKSLLSKMVKPYFPQATIIFKKDLAGKWRLARIEIL